MKLYEIIIADTAIDPGVELVHDDRRAAVVVFESMRETFGSDAVAILREGAQITAAQLTSDIETFEIEQVIEQDTLRPSGYRDGRGGDSDLAFGTDGYAHAVHKPPNPEDDWN
jgi:hypothetical protein